MAKFKKGEGGRPRGAKGKITKSVKTAFLEVFTDMQKDPSQKYALAQWGRNNPNLFYPLAAKLIPVEVAGSVQTISVSLKKKESDDPSGD